MSRGAERCLALLRWYASRFERVYPKRSTLAKRLAVSSRSVDNYLRELKTCGFVGILQEGPHPASYHVLSAENCEASAKLLRSFSDPTYSYMSLSSNTQSSLASATPVERPEENPSLEGQNLNPQTGDAQNFRNEIIETLKTACRMPTPKRPPMPEELCRAVRHASGDFR